MGVSERARRSLEAWGKAAPLSGEEEQGQGGDGKVARNRVQGLSRLGVEAQRRA